MITVRQAEATDAKFFAEIYRPYVLNTAITFETEPPDEEAFKHRILTVTQNYPFLAATEDGEVIGYAYATQYRSRAAYIHSAEASIYLKQTKTGLGIGKLLYDKLEKCLVRQNICMFYACITYPNPSSTAFHEKDGFSLIGAFRNSGFKGGKWYDTLWYEKQLISPETAEQGFIQFSEIKDAVRL